MISRLVLLAAVALVFTFAAVPSRAIAAQTSAPPPVDPQQVSVYLSGEGNNYHRETCRQLGKSRFAAAKTSLAVR